MDEIVDISPKGSVPFNGRSQRDFTWNSGGQ